MCQSQTVSTVDTLVAILRGFTPGRVGWALKQLEEIFKDNNENKLREEREKREEREAKEEVASSSFSEPLRVVRLQ